MKRARRTKLAAIGVALALSSCGARTSLPEDSPAPATLPDSRDPPTFEAPTGVQRQIAAGYEHTCAIREGQVYCWGSNRSGQIGDGTKADAKVPRAIDLSDALSLDAGPEVDLGFSQRGSTTCAVRADRTVWCWGANVDGTTGLGTIHTTDGVRLVPTQVPGVASAVATAVAFDGGCARRIDGRVVCWGIGLSGDGQHHIPPATTEVPDLDRVVDIAAGRDHACAVRDDGGVYCWGSFWMNDSVTEIPTPRRIEGLPAVIEVSALSRHVCALANDDTVWCWGTNHLGELGDGTTLDRSEPVRVVGLTGVRRVVAAPDGTFAILHDGTVVGWGRPSLGAFDENVASTKETAGWSLVPAPCPGLAGVRDLAPGYWHACSLHDDGEVQCWGGNHDGKLGDGTEEDHYNPAPVKW